jgi:hypothetical protein
MLIVARGATPGMMFRYQLFQDPSGLCVHGLQASLIGGNSFSGGRVTILGEMSQKHLPGSAGLFVEILHELLTVLEGPIGDSEVSGYL